MGSGAGKEKYKAHKVEKVFVVSPKSAAPTMHVAASRVPYQNPTLLAADVGGTSSRLHLFAPPDDLAKDLQVPASKLILKEKYANEKFESFTDVLRNFLFKAGLEQPPCIACIAAAGVVVDNKCHLVNLGWHLDGDEIAHELGIADVHLINDFEAQGYGILTLDRQKECDILQDAPSLAGAPIAVLGAGTGLGEAFMTTGENGDYEVWPTEGGHAEFAPRQDGSSKLQFEMCQYLQIKYSAKSRISVERIVSGRGIANIYHFLAWKFPEKVNRKVHRRFLGPIEGPATNDPAAIVEAARSGECEVCLQALDLFVGAYGAEAGVIALKYMPFAGLYITGGVSVKTRDFILGQKGQEHHFMDAFLDKGRVTPMLMRVPVYLVKVEDMGERGVKLKAVRMFAEAQSMREHSKGHM